jgi:hypothetical protein
VGVGWIGTRTGLCIWFGWPIVLNWLYNLKPLCSYFGA